MSRTDPAVLADIAAFDTPTASNGVRVTVADLANSPAELLAEMQAARRREDAPIPEYYKPGATLATIRDYFANGFWEAGELVGDPAQ